ncbi:hypothetical protein A5636_14935 [Mycobacterium asiaticum]|uniref:Uncharacterized protein n=1 Tax=Mycobacterium asiaticum TaxID=1790 RepID=A0A1A3MR35_MYCAS|nr:hypothetical protein A5636_14935 [Mycobacterium asiaticum]
MRWSLPVIAPGDHDLRLGDHRGATTLVSNCITWPQDEPAPAAAELAQPPRLTTTGLISLLVGEWV